MSLLTGVTIGLSLVIFVCFVSYLIWRHIFQCSGYFMKNILYKSSNLIIQRLCEGKSKTLIVIGNGWDVSLNSDNQIVKHDPIFRIPKKDVKLLNEGNASYEVITAYFPFECEEIDKSAMELAYYLNHNYRDYKIILLGHSKSATQFAQALNYLDRDEGDVKLIFVSPTFGGVASSEEIKANLGLLDRIVFRLLFISHKVNDDITKKSYFLTKVADFSKISNYKAYLIKSRINRKFFNLLNYYLVHLDKKLALIGDGIIGYNEQYCEADWTQQFNIEANHISSLTVAIKEMKDLSIL